MQQAELVEQEQQAPTTHSLALVVERLAANPSVDVAKLEKIIELQERVLANQAKAAFDAAFTEMQADLPTVVEYGRTNNGRYAPLEDIIETVRPILHKHGFGLSHKTEWPDKDTVRIIGILTHREGHERRSEFLSSADESGNKNDIQGLGSAVSYGRRYTTKDLLNIVTRNEDTDGNRPKKDAPAPPAPEGYDKWLDDMQSVVDNGWPAFSKAWNESKKEWRTYLTTTAPQLAAKLKAKAQAVKG